MNKSVSIITDLDGSKIALINDIRFKSRKGIDWNEVEQYLKEYIGEYFEISETSEKIYIGSDFPDEFSHSNDTKGLKGANMKAKANITPAIGELIQIASEKAQYPDYKNKHGAKAQFGWYRYNTRFGIPVYDEDGNLAKKIEPDGGTWTYLYFGNGMLREVTRPDKSCVSFQYDTFGRRIEKSVTSIHSKGVSEGRQ